MFVGMCTTYLQMPKEAKRGLELELQVVVNCLLGTRPRHSARIASAVNH